MIWTRITMTHFARMIIIATLLFCGAAAADQADPPMYVLSTGADTGNCQDVNAPCRTIDYALQRVGKSGQIRVGGGSYSIADPQNVVYMLSNAIDVRGSYTDGERSILVGVPPEFRGQLMAKGFHVVVDSKGLDRERREANKNIVDMQKQLSATIAAADCNGGSADGFPCNNVDLIGRIPDRTSAASGTDIWGFMDLNSHREYAIMGYSNGTAVYDVTDATNPREVGFIDGQNTDWRDIKVYQFWDAAETRWKAYAYVIAERVSDGLFIIDLTQLPERIERVSYNSDFGPAHNVYISGVDPATGLAISDNIPTLVVAGAGISDGRFRGYSLQNPQAPAFIAAPSTPADQPGGDRLYMHDAASMLVTDARKDTQCSNTGGGNHCDVLFDFNEDSFEIWDISDPATPVRLSRTPYPGATYTHSGWWSEDQQYLYVQDELDESNNNDPTTLRVFSIADLTAPVPVGSWIGPTGAIDHNGFVRGNRYYMSNYTRGLTVLDISDGANPVEAGRFDTYPSSDQRGFPGNWGVYPFLPSGVLAVSDIDSGLYLLADRTLDVAQGSYRFAADSFGNDESQTLQLVVQRTGGAQGASSVRWEVISATAGSADVGAMSGTLNWPDGDTSNRSINLPLVNDGMDEGLERVLVRLIDPKAGATLSAPSFASAYIADPGDTSTVQFADATSTVAERGFATLVAVLQRQEAATGAVSVDYQVTNGSAVLGSDFSGPATGTVSWADGDATPKTIEFAVSDDGSGEADEDFSILLSNAVGATLGSNNVLSVTILDGTGINTAPNAIAGSSQTVTIGATVTLDGGASNDPDGDSLNYAWNQISGTNVTLSSATSASATFNAPSVSSDTLLRFELTVTDPRGLQDKAIANVTVQANATNSGGGGGGGGGGTISFALLFSLGLLALLAIQQKDASLRSSVRDQGRLR